MNKLAQVGASPIAHDPDDLMRLFDALFKVSENTVLVRGGEEPLYLPADETCPHDRVIFARGYFASAMHEISHWCIAGPARRRQVDYGYWYCPDGRSAEQQRAFEQVEVKPQALEWIFAEAAGSPFRLSLDNLSGETSGHPDGFRHAVCLQAQAYLRDGLPERAARFVNALLDYYDRHEHFSVECFVLTRLR